MIVFRRALVALIALTAVLGIGLRVIPTSSTARQDVLFDWSRLEAKRGERLGPFLYEATVMSGGQSLRLRSVQCVDPIYATPQPVQLAPPDQLIALRYPPSDWQTSYVYRGQVSASIARVPAYMRNFALRVLSAMTLSASSRDLADGTFVSFHVPIACSLDPSAATAAVVAILSAATRRVGVAP